MTTYRYLGWGKTNENGIAKLDHNSEGQEIEHSYTGTGAGEIDVLASLDNPVAEGSIVSGTYSVIDATFRDGATGTDYNSKIVNHANILQYDRQEDGTLLTAPTSRGYWIFNQTSSSEYPLSENFCIECDIVSVTSGVKLNLVNGVWAYWDFGNESNLHIKIECTDTEQVITVNGHEEYRHLHTYSENTSVRFQVDQNASVKYKNFIIYPI